MYHLATLKAPFLVLRALLLLRWGSLVLDRIRSVLSVTLNEARSNLSKALVTLFFDELFISEPRDNSHYNDYYNGLNVKHLLASILR